MGGLLLFPAPDLAVLELTGGDRGTFLNALVSNEVASLAPGEGREALLLTPKGKLVAPLSVLATEEALLVTVPLPLREAIARKLSRYVLRNDVAVADATDRLAILRLGGPGATDAIAAARAPALATTASGLPGYDLFVSADREGAAAVVLCAAGARKIEASDAEAIRVAAGEPRWGSEMDEDLLPPEIPALVSRAISYTKGCYVGQETIARIKTYGHVNRELRRLEFEGDEGPAPGAELLAEGKAVGRVTSVARHPETGAGIALGFVRRGHFEPGTELATETPGGRVRVVVKQR